MKKTIIIAAFILIFAVTVLMGCNNKASNEAPANKVVSAVCPVMKTEIPNVSKAVGESIYNGETYYFCCDECKPMFDANPSKYVDESTN